MCDKGMTMNQLECLVKYVISRSSTLMFKRYFYGCSYCTTLQLVNSHVNTTWYRLGCWYLSWLGFWVCKEPKSHSHTFVAHQAVRNNLSSIIFFGDIHDGPNTNLQSPMYLLS
jgi:hypothetical protein